MSDRTPRVIGSLLLAAGAIAQTELRGALVEQRRTRERLGEVLVRRGLAAEHVARALAAQLRLPYAPAPLEPDPAAARLLDGPLATRLQVVPLVLSERTIQVAMADPLDVSAIDDLQFQTGRRVEPVVAEPAAVAVALTVLYGASAAPPGHTAAGRGRGVPAARLPTEARPDENGAVAPELAQLQRVVHTPSVVALVDRLIRQAVEARASDVHVEPVGDALRVRIRVDGALRELARLDAVMGPAVVSRIKVMADLDIAVKRRPQDGRSSLRVGDRDFGLRVSTLPSREGEKAVLRLLDPGNAAQSLDVLGLESATHARLTRMLGRSHGVILVTGPTGSGKTTTLYAALSTLDRKTRNIITLEDPVEYKLAGVTQVQMQPRAGLGFAAALRAVLRQDPDVIMVGELRDRETVETAMAAALTGHLVLSTLHTNDAPTAATRLGEMRAPPYLVAAGLIGVMAQRLARRLCDRCRQPRMAAPEELAAAGLPTRAVQVYEARGCPACDGTGYSGRVGIFELLLVDGRVRELVLRRASAAAIREAARAAGMTTLGEAAWSKVTAGFTTLEEVRPLLALLADEGPACPSCNERIRPAFQVCPRCGQRLRRRCLCGAALEPGWRICPACGDEAPPVDTPQSTMAGTVGAG